MFADTQAHAYNQPILDGSAIINQLIYRYKGRYMVYMIIKVIHIKYIQSHVCAYVCMKQR